MCPPYVQKITLTFWIEKTLDIATFINKWLLSLLIYHAQWQLICDSFKEEKVKQDVDFPRRYVLGNVDRIIHSQRRAAKEIYRVDFPCVSVKWEKY